jgi:hypothetical protein
MAWTETTDPGSGDGLREWEREDGAATIRLRARPDGTWVVRLDRLYQAPEGSRYRRRDAEEFEEAMAVVEEWRREHGQEG